jgi:hypothetical protein
VVVTRDLKVKSEKWERLFADKLFARHAKCMRNGRGADYRKSAPKSRAGIARMKTTTKVATMKAHHAFMNSFTSSPKGIWIPVITEEDAIEAREVEDLAVGDISVSMPRTMLASIYPSEWDRRAAL